ncbi:unnamed protein product [Bemisia tabaci]|uniref:CBF1-interacting co-repressor CIR N-terminal domain-containing protein n=1 Tax=Bemisia tabaci TaxID=7038 RepID=A0A9P0EXX6_BEMTA|nr:unnamed protein product [Bemisia tabaci]
MNILPKKRWHVRTKDNIARVRRDEAQAAEEEREKLRRIQLAEKEARIEFLKKKARAQYHHEETKLEEEKEVKVTDGTSEPEHVNFFKDIEEGLVKFTGKNAEHDKEIKEEKEKYEKQIGYLTYLGQDTNEATGKVSWYNKAPDSHEQLSIEDANNECSLKAKLFLDPLKSIKIYTSLMSKSRPKANSVIPPSTSSNFSNTIRAPSLIPSAKSISSNCVAVKRNESSRREIGKAKLKKRKKTKRRDSDRVDNKSSSHRSRSQSEKRPQRMDDSSSEHSSVSLTHSSRKKKKKHEQNSHNRHKSKKICSASGSKRSKSDSNGLSKRRKSKKVYKNKRSQKSDSSSNSDSDSSASHSSSSSSDSSSTSCSLSDSSTSREGEKIKIHPSSQASVDELRAQRLKREAEEKMKAQKLLARLRGEVLPEDKPSQPVLQQKYNSQFNPHLAKQNYADEIKRSRPKR